MKQWFIIQLTVPVQGQELTGAFPQVWGARRTLVLDKLLSHHREANTPTHRPGETSLWTPVQHVQLLSVEGGRENLEKTHIGKCANSTDIDPDQELIFLSSSVLTKSHYRRTCWILYPTAALKYCAFTPKSHLGKGVSKHIKLAVFYHHCPKI